MNPGDVYYFTILINNKAFPVGVATFDEPVFLHRYILIAVFAVIAIISMIVFACWAAILLMHHQLHGALGPLPLIVNAEVLISIVIWTGKNLKTVRWISLLCFILMSLIALRTIPDLRNNYEGLIQRLFYLGWTIWSIYLSVFFTMLSGYEIKSAQ